MADPIHSDGNLRRVIDTIPALAWCAKPDGSMEFLNKRWHDYTGLSYAETAGWGFPFITPETLLRSEEILQRPHWTEELRREYCRPWMTVISEKQLQRGMYLAPLIRVWARLRRLLHSSFESEPERYWHPALYRYLLVGYAQKLLRMTSSWL